VGASGEEDGLAGVTLVQYADREVSCAEVDDAGLGCSADMWRAGFGGCQQAGVVVGPHLHAVWVDGDGVPSVMLGGQLNGER
jgi:hypothetical protein